MLDRLIGVVTLKAPKYREIADDTAGTGQAAIIVVVVSLIVGLVQAFVFVDPSRPSPGVGGAISSVVSALIGWVVAGWVTAFVATKFFGGKTNTGEMLRVFGYTRIFEILGVIPVVGIIGVILSAIGNVIGIREAAEFDTTKAILTAVIVIVIYFLVVFVLLAAVFALIFATGAAGGAR